MMQVEEMRKIVQQMTAVIKREVSRKNKSLVIRKAGEHRHSRLKSQLFTHGRKIPARTISITRTTEFSLGFRVL